MRAANKFVRFGLFLCPFAARSSEATPKGNQQQRSFLIWPSSVGCLDWLPPPPESQSKFLRSRGPSEPNLFHLACVSACPARYLLSSSISLLLFVFYGPLDVNKSSSSHTFEGTTELFRFEEEFSRATKKRFPVRKISNFGGDGKIIETWIFRVGCKSGLKACFFIILGVIFELLWKRFDILEGVDCFFVDHPYLCWWRLAMSWQARYSQQR